MCFLARNHPTQHFFDGKGRDLLCGVIGGDRHELIVGSFPVAPLAAIIQGGTLLSQLRQGVGDILSRTAVNDCGSLRSFRYNFQLTQLGRTFLMREM